MLWLFYIYVQHCYNDTETFIWTYELNWEQQQLLGDWKWQESNHSEVGGHYDPTAVCGTLMAHKRPQLISPAAN